MPRLVKIDKQNLFHPVSIESCQLNFPCCQVFRGLQKTLVWWQTALEHLMNQNPAQLISHFVRFRHDLNRISLLFLHQKLRSQHRMAEKLKWKTIYYLIEWKTKVNGSFTLYSSSRHTYRVCLNWEKVYYCVWLFDEHWNWFDVYWNRDSKNNILPKIAKVQLNWHILVQSSVKPERKSMCHE